MTCGQFKWILCIIREKVDTLLGTNWSNQVLTMERNIRNHLATNDVRIFPRDPTESYPKWPKVDPRLGNTTTGPAFHILWLIIMLTDD